MGFKKISAAFFAALLVLSCEKPYEVDYPLAVDSRLVKLSSKAGKTRVVVWSDRDWKCGLWSQDKVWATLDRESGHGMGDMLFTYEANPGVTRSLAIALSAGAVKDTVWMQQAGAITAPRFTPATRNFSPSSAGGHLGTTVTTNLSPCFDRIVPIIKWTEGDGGWISGVKVASEGISFDVAVNISGSVRKAEILFDIPGMVEPSPFPAALITVTQNP
jgi:hypothetical protein